MRVLGQKKNYRAGQAGLGLKAKIVNGRMLAFTFY